MWYQNGGIQMKKEDIKNFVGNAINKEKFEEIPEFLWLWDDFLYFIIKEKVLPKNFNAFWECIRNRTLNEDHYGALLDKGITFDMMEIMEIDESLFEAALKRKWLHNELLRYHYILTNNQVVKLFTEGDFHSKKSLEILYNRIVESKQLTPQQLVKVMCKCKNVKTVEQLVEEIPSYYWKQEEFLKLIAIGGPVYSDKDYFDIISKIIFHSEYLDLTNIVDLFGYSGFYKFFEEEDLAEFYVVSLYGETMTKSRDMSGNQWDLLVSACGSAERAVQKLTKYGYTPTESQLSELKKHHNMS